MTQHESLHRELAHGSDMRSSIVRTTESIYVVPQQQQHLLIFSPLSLQYGQISSFMVNPNGQYGNVPLLHALIGGWYTLHC